jgi:GDP-mannose pyrophosphatase NudK
MGNIMNKRIRNIEKTLLSDNWYTLNKYVFDYQNTNGQWQRQVRESYDRGNGATVLLYNSDEGKIVLTRQFRMPTYVNGNPDGMLIETCAGLLEQDNPEDCIIREIEEETGYQINKVKKLFEAYMSPGSVTEVVHFFIAQYQDTMRVSEGGGLAQEQEYIEVLEMDFDLAYNMIASGEIKDAKTIMLLQYAKLHHLCENKTGPTIS